MEKQPSMERTIIVGEREIELVCPICGGKKFWERKTLMNTAGMTFLGYDWLNAEATNYICEDCSYIYWFMEKPVLTSDEPVKPKELTPVQQYEQEFADYADAVLYKICYSHQYSEEKKKAARNILNRRGVRV